MDYAASLVLDGLLDVESDGSPDALSAFEDYSDQATRGQSITISELANIAVSESGANGQAATAVSVTSNKMIVDQPAFINHYVQDIEDILAFNGAGASKISTALYRKMRSFVAKKIINAARENLIASGDTGLIANAGAGTLTDADIALAEALVCDQAGVSQDTPLVIVGSSGFTSACKGLVNYQPPTNSVGMGRLEYVNGRQYFQTSALESRAGGLDAVISDSVVASNVVTQTVPTNHHFVRGGLVTTSGLTVDASTATPITSTTATSVVHALTASNGQQADHAGTLLSASSIGLVFVKPWACFGIAGGSYKVRILEAGDGPGYNVQCYCWYGTHVRAGGVAAVHAPMIG